MGESDLQLSSDRPLQSLSREILGNIREEILEAEKWFRGFFTALEPVSPRCASSSQPPPAILSHMCRASLLFGVGPMACVAGAVNHYLAQALAPHCSELLVENGGDCLLATSSARRVRIDARSSPFGDRLQLHVRTQDQPIGVCTSSGTLGHSLSFGKADAVVILAKDSLIADAAATFFANQVHCPADVPRVAEHARSFSEISGGVFICGSTLGACGNIAFVPESKPLPEGGV